MTTEQNPVVNENLNERAELVREFKDGTIITSKENGSYHIVKPNGDTYETELAPADLISVIMRHNIPE